MTLPQGLSANDVAAIWRLPVATVYWLASVHHWRRYRSGGRVYYHPADVATTLENRDQPGEAEPADPHLPGLSGGSGLEVKLRA